MSWMEFLGWLQSDGINAVVGFFLSYGVEYWPKFGELDPKWQRVVFLALCLVVPLVGAGLSIAFGYQAASWTDTFWPAILAGGLAFGAGTVAHTRKL